MTTMIDPSHEIIAGQTIYEDFIRFSARTAETFDIAYKVDNQHDVNAAADFVLRLLSEHDCEAIELPDLEDDPVLPKAPRTLLIVDGIPLVHTILVDEAGDAFAGSIEARFHYDLPEDCLED